MGTLALQQNMSFSRLFVLGALVPAMLLATWLGSVSVDDGRSGQPDHSGKKTLALVTFTSAVMI